MKPFARFKKDFTNKKVLIFGLGIQGRGLGDAKIFSQIGAQVSVADKKTKSKLKPSISQLTQYQINYHLGQEPQPQLITSQDAIIRNASVPWNHPSLELARKHHIPIYMDACLFFQYAKPQHAIGITGTRGKTTTTQILHHTLISSGHQSIIAGNASPTASIQLLKNYQPNTWYVFELSSWQLQSFHQAQISPHYSIITNLYPDHLLDRSFNQYAADKTAIFKYQQPTDFFTTNDFQTQTKPFLKQSIAPSKAYNHTQLPPINNSKLPGPHNHHNLQAAFTILQQLNLTKPDFAAAIDSFTPPPFRLQPIATINQVTIINDTTSTTPIATQMALKTYPNSILICGGTTKNLPTKALAQAINHHAKAVYLLSGSGTDELKPQLHPELIQLESSNLESLTQAALKQAKPSETLLFSPGFTSFGLYQNEFDRGRHFNQIVKQLHQ